MLLRLGIQEDQISMGSGFVHDRSAPSTEHEADNHVMLPLGITLCGPSIAHNRSACSFLIGRCVHKRGFSSGV